MPNDKQNEDKVKLSPFVRFRHGTELRIEPNVKESIENFISEYKKKPNEAFRSLITDIADGSGAGISAESTWYQAIRELFNHLDDYSSINKEKVNKKYIEFLHILSSTGSSSEAWNAIKEFVAKNIETLSLWEFSHHRSMMESSQAYRDEDGKVYESEEDGLVEIIDGQTLAEAKYSYVLDDIYGKYGSLGLLLRLTRIVFIENSLCDFDYDFSLVRFVMSEASDGYGTWFLQGYWQVIAAKRERNVRWHPQDFYTDLEWLESDLSLIASAIADNESSESTHPDSPVFPDVNDEDLFQKSIEGFSYQYELALDTSVFIADENDNIQGEIYIEFEDRLVRWVNGSLHRCPVLIVPTNDPTYEEAISLAKRFVSLILFEHPYVVIRESANVGHAARYAPAMIRQPRLPSITSISSEWINRAALSTSQNTWLALSFYKEAKNSESVFYKFLNYYKVVQRAFINTNGSEDTRSCINWLDQEIQGMSQDAEVQQLIQDQTNLNTTENLSLSVGTYLQHTFRDAVSHVGLLDRRVSSGYPTVSPDNLPDQHRYRNAVPVIEKLARKTINDSMHG